MAEALGLAANIIAIAGAATQLSIGLYEIASALKDAGPEVRVIANETSLFSRVLKEVSTVLEGNTAIAWRARSIAEDLVQVCQTVQQDGERLLQVLQPLVQQTGSQRQRLALRIRWLFQRSKFIYHRDTLGSLKLNLQLLISIMQMTREPQEQIYISLSYEVQSLKSVVESNIHMMQMNLQSPSMVNALSKQMPEDFKESAAPQSDLDSDSLSTLDVDQSNLNRQLEGSSLEIHASSASIQPDLAIIDAKQEEPTDYERVGPLALIPYFRLLFLQEKVSTFAGEVLAAPKETEHTEEIPILQQNIDDVSMSQSSSTIGAASIDGSSQGRRSESTPPTSIGGASTEEAGQIYNSVERTPSRNSTPTPLDKVQTRNSLPGPVGVQNTASTTEKKRAKRRGKPRPSITPEGSSNDGDTVSAFSTDSESQKLSKQATGTYLSSPRVQDVTEEADEMVRQPNKTSKKIRKETEEQDHVDEDSLTESKSTPIKFKDCVGREFSLPWKLCKTWQGMKDLIRQMFQHIDAMDQRVRVDQHVYDGHYDLIGREGETILPQAWEEVIEPGMYITMHMWPSEARTKLHKAVDPILGHPPPTAPISPIDLDFGPPPKKSPKSKKDSNNFLPFPPDPFSVPSLNLKQPSNSSHSIKDWGEYVGSSKKKSKKDESAKRNTTGATSLPDPYGYGPTSFSPGGLRGSSPVPPPPAPTNSKKDIIWVKTPEDDEYTLDFELCRTYGDLLDSLLSEFTGLLEVNSEYWRDRITQCIDDGEIKILKGGYQSEPISKSMWATEVRPDMTIAVAFIDEEVDRKFGAGRADEIKRSGRAGFSWLSRDKKNRGKKNN